MPAPARTNKPKKQYPNIEVLSVDDTTFTVKLLGDPEPFVLTTEVNGFLHMEAFTNTSNGSLSELLFSMIEVLVDDDADEDAIETARFEVKHRVTTLLKTAKPFTINDYVKLVANLCEIAGNAHSK